MVWIGIFSKRSLYNRACPHSLLFGYGKTPIDDPQMKHGVKAMMPDCVAYCATESILFQ